VNIVEAEGERIWMPVQSPLIPDFQTELGRGDAVDLFIMAVGTIDEDRHEWVFAVNELPCWLREARADTDMRERAIKCPDAIAQK
jgi:hypothetical protein